MVSIRLRILMMRTVMRMAVMRMNMMIVVFMVTARRSSSAQVNTNVLP